MARTVSPGATAPGASFSWLRWGGGKLSHLPATARPNVCDGAAVVWSPARATKQSGYICRVIEETSAYPTAGIFHPVGAYEER
ncbi:MAG: hypothetical protein ABI947_14370 [Chloroflexota bacterium]